jgi:hypothetical protein
MRNGGLAYLQHYLLRFLLWRTGVLPWRTIHFLDGAASRILLYRVGGGYRFIHQSFLGYFASLAPSSAQSTAQVSQEVSSRTPSAQPSSTQLANLAFTQEDQTYTPPLHTVEAAWFVRLGLIALLVFGGYVAVLGIDAYQYRAKIDHVMATSPYPSYFPGHGKISLYDPLSDANPNHWKEDDNDKKYCHYVDSAYHIYTDDFLHLSSQCPSEQIFNDFAFSVSMTIINGDCGGITIAYLYQFDVCTDGYYYLHEYDVNGWTDATNLIREFYRPEVITSLKQSNELSLVAQGENITLFINSQKVGETSLHWVIKGQIGLDAANKSGTLAEVAYKDAKVWTL